MDVSSNNIFRNCGIQIGKEQSSIGFNLYFSSYCSSLEGQHRLMITSSDKDHRKVVILFPATQSATEFLTVSSNMSLE